MLVGKLIEMVSQNLYGILHLRSLPAMLDLKEKTLTEITRSDPRRIELLDNLEHIHHLLLVSLDICTE